MAPRVFVLFGRSSTRRSIHARVAHGFPVNADDIVLNDINAPQIVAIVNDTWTNTLDANIERLIHLIAPPPSPLYHPVPPGGVTGNCVVFLWATLRRSDRVRFGAHYAIPFYIKSAYHRGAPHLAYVLGRFSINAYSDYAQHNTNPNVRAPRLRRLSYLLYETGVLGVMLYDHGLDASYNVARVDSLNDPENCYSEEFHIPISTWPAADPTMRGHHAVHWAMSAARLLLKL
ncbi:hypothetical protein B0H21DRAFT_821045 [Amylocystis lapponica]|nr:hypothetical protein B0H21DRAFT_821045 [Amylocystis lapponica]